MAEENIEEKFNDERAKITPKQPCEVALWHILPCIRACLARELVTMDLTQQEVADILGITQAAVSQYIGEKRGKFKANDNNVYEMIEELAVDLKRDEVNDLSKRICKICSQVQSNPELLKSCGVPDSKADKINIC